MPRPRYSHVSRTVAVTPADLDAMAVAECVGAPVSPELMWKLKLIAGQYAALNSESTHGASVGEVRKHLTETRQAVEKLRAMLELAEQAPALMFELNVLRDFLERSPRVMPKTLRIDPNGVIDDLEALDAYLEYLEQQHQTSPDLERVYGVSARSAWDTLVNQLVRWCEEAGVSTAFHARVPDAAPPPLRRLIALIDAPPLVARGQLMSDETMIRAIERALGR